MSTVFILMIAVVGSVIMGSPTGAAAAAPAPPATYEENSSAIAYNGSWTTLTSSGSSGGSIRYSTVASASASLTFSGSWITWYTWKSPNAGIARVLVDGVEVARVDNYSKTSVTGVIGYSAPVVDGTHTITVVGSGSKNAASGGRMTHFDSFVVTAETVAPYADASVPRAEDCPTATQTVTNAAELTAALKGAQPGDVIRLADGTYTGKFALSVSATRDRPVWICGSPRAVLTTGAIDTGSALRIDASSNIVLTGFTVERSLQGIMIKYSSRMVLSDLVVRDTGYEGIHLYAMTSDSVVAHSTLARNGSLDVSYGEGVYIGTSQRRWDEVTGGEPDASNRNVIVSNRFVQTGAESIDAKEGTSGGTVADNTFEGFLNGSRALGWVLVTGNEWAIIGNDGDDAVGNAYSSLSWGDWGYDNEFRDNTGRVGSSGYGVWVHDKTRGVAVACDNQVTAAGSGNTNVFCSS
ncbi:NosD domain-containing protein [Microbacterium sp. Leaf151]|uniref:NosD domain-containing protein n=1 Tax=Microbacterium sp. Leaf151 TaxID=1736276 RepID=UPI0006FCC3EF|nr:right-handed parallel beta-helix repeat-containing protein [Microbacterium sp. Leaf151]KQR23430.1 hypothetical protein ASF76_09595 [Microbacterium sp. Leaf151]